MVHGDLRSLRSARHWFLSGGLAGASKKAEIASQPWPTHLLRSVPTTSGPKEGAHRPAVRSANAGWRRAVAIDYAGTKRYEAIVTAHTTGTKHPKDLRSGVSGC